MNRLQQEWLLISGPLFLWIVFNALILIASPGIAGIKSVSNLSELENLVLNKSGITITSYNDINHLEQLPRINCQESWSDIGEREPDPAYANGSMYGISCDLPRMWVRSSGLWNLVIPFISTAYFSFDEQDNLVGSSISVFGYYTRLFYR